MSLPRTKLAVTFLVLSASALTPLFAEKLAIKAGKIITVAGDPIDDGVILISDGKIESVGKEISIPIDAKVIDASGKTVLPGFIDAHNSSGMSQANEVNPNVPFLSVVDSIDPSRDYFEECRRNGVTTVAVVPGNSTMIGGQSAIIKTAGGYVDEMILKRESGIKVSLRPRSGSRMSQLAKLRKELEKARRAESEDDGKETKDESKSDDKKEASEDETKKADSTSSTSSSSSSSSSSDSAKQLEAMRKLIRGEVPTFIYCENAMDVVQALSLTKKYKLKSILVLGRECYKAADALAKSKLPVILDPTLVYWKTDPRTGKDEKIVLPRIYREKEIPIAFQVSGSSRSTLGSNYLWYQAATAVKYGTDRAAALRAITLRPAEILGVADFVGSIEPGKDADLVILSGDPLKLDTWVDQTIVNGRVVYDRDEDRKLRELLETTTD